jgi:hypothetical protein
MYDNIVIIGTKTTVTKLLSLWRNVVSDVPSATFKTYGRSKRLALLQTAVGHPQSSYQQHGRDYLQPVRTSERWNLVVLRGWVVADVPVFYPTALSRLLLWVPSNIAYIKGWNEER